MTGLVCAIQMGKHLTERAVGEGRELNGDHLFEGMLLLGGMLLGVSDGVAGLRGGQCEAL